MQQTTIEMFLNFLQEQNHTKGTVNSYVRLISDLEEPPETDNPRDLLSFIDNALSLKKAVLNRTSFASARASLSSFFFMKTGIHIKEYRKQCIPKDMYDPLMEQYGSYCRDFLHLTEPVTLAAIREVKAFLKIIAPEPTKVDRQREIKYRIMHRLVIMLQETKETSNRRYSNTQACST